MSDFENIELKVFSVADLKNFFLHNKTVDLLSEHVISRTRAYASIMNPFCSDQTIIISALYIDKHVVAYTYVFPDELMVYNKDFDSFEEKSIYWNTVLYVDRDYEGRGFGSIVIGQMVEIYGDSYYDLDAIPASIENLKFAGLQVDYINQFLFEEKKINLNSIKGRLVKLIDSFKKLISGDEHRLKYIISKTDYTISYNNFVDDESYSFIKSCCNGNLFMRSQLMLNWILSYPCCQTSPLPDRIDNKCYFSSFAPVFNKVFVQVRGENGNIIGVYLYRNTDKLLYIEYLYYLEDCKNTVFYSIIEHILKLKPEKFFTADKKLFDLIKSYNIFSKSILFKKSFSHPASFTFDNELYIQAGDGDNFV